MRVSFVPVDNRNQRATAAYSRTCLKHAMNQMKAWYIEACGEKRALRKADRFHTLQLYRRGVRRLKVSCDTDSAVPVEQSSIGFSFSSTGGFTYYS
jgi:hypothetical protein